MGAFNVAEFVKIPKAIRMGETPNSHEFGYGPLGRI
jgi:hypothetical protein